MKHPFVVDGQRKPRPQDVPIDLLDSVGIDRRMTEQPLVFEASVEDFLAAGGWIATIPAELL